MSGPKGPQILNMYNYESPCIRPYISSLIKMGPELSLLNSQVIVVSVITYVAQQPNLYNYKSHFPMGHAHQVWLKLAQLSKEM